MKELITELITITGVLVVIVNLVTEVYKSVFEVKVEKSINLFVLICSEVLTLIAMVGFCQYYYIKLTALLFVTFIIAGVLVAYAAMFGFDKLLKHFEDFKR